MFAQVMEFKPTRKGLLRGEFIDRYGQTCSVQESSIAGEECTWMGVEVDRDGKEVTNGRMHLTREMARKLIPVLRHFVREGSLGFDEPREKFNIGAWVLGVGKDNRGIEGRVVAMQRGEYLTVQDQHRPSEAGQHVCAWQVADLIWVPIEVPDHIPTRYERLTEDDELSDDSD